MLCLYTAVFFLGSVAIAGILHVIALKIFDKSGVTVQDAHKGNSIKITEDSLLGLKYDPTSIWGYFELHIEQGPVLELVDDEAKAQSGERSKHYAEIGWSKNQEVAKTNPKLVAMNKKFGMIHGEIYNFWCGLNC
ncbi:hypothetical protein GOBAR_AA06348 [Gossypium barbadense]|uniref:Uncharacterized protein n=1 Tax=Gossypium barbadense TaxID=3634 RepID=A0A2P5YF87_GOSBA|nr:hypothetical protein GOBAR_AA06348 [Gossypium barbadense]